MKLNIITSTLIWLTIFELSTAKIDTEEFLFTMPPIKPSKDQVYVCTAMEMPRDEHIYLMDIEEFIADKYIGFIHHVQTYSCLVPGYMEKDSPQAVWNCGENDDDNFPIKAPICQEGYRFLPKLRDIPNLPDEVGLKAGGDSDIKYLVLQLHYGNVAAVKDDEPPYEIGVTVRTLPGLTNIPVKQVYSYTLLTEGLLPTNTTVYMESACEIEEDLTVHPLGYLTHTHGLGLQVAGYVQKSNGSWYRLGITPEDTTNFADNVFDYGLPGIGKGDVIATRCVSHNFRDHEVKVGTETLNEMCNFIFLYYTDENKEMKNHVCGTEGPPNYYWDWDIIIKDIPKWVQDDPLKIANRIKYRI